MRGWSSPDTKVIGRLNESSSEVVLPNPIDHHTCGQRVINPRQPLCEFQSTTSRRIGRQRMATQGLDETARHFLARLIRLPPHLHSRIVRRPLSHTISHRERPLDDQVGVSLIESGGIETADGTCGTR